MTIDRSPDREFQIERNPEPKSASELTQGELDRAADALFWTDVPQVCMDDIVDILHAIGSGRVTPLNSPTNPRTGQPYVPDQRRAYDAAVRLQKRVRELAINGRA